MSDWAENEAKNHWVKGKLSIKKAAVGGGRFVYHVYSDGKYIAQGSDLKDAKAKALKKGGKVDA